MQQNEDVIKGILSLHQEHTELSNDKDNQKQKFKFS